MKKYIQEHKYVLLVLYVPVYLIWFALAERMVPTTDGCWVSYLPLDDKIPFLPGFILAYVLWYPFLIFPVIVMLLEDDRRAFIRYGAFIISGFSISLTICMIWPNCQLLRPAVVDTSNLCGWLVNAIYTADTPTNVLPSMHVVDCMGVLAAVFDSQYLKKARIPSVIVAAAICAATVFVKQHSILDVFAALALSLVLYLVIYVAARRGIDHRHAPAAAGRSRDHVRKRKERIARMDRRKIVEKLEQAEQENLNTKPKRAVVAVYWILRLIVIAVMVMTVIHKDYESTFVCVLVLILFMLPRFVERNFRIELPSTLEIIILVFIFAAEILGELKSYFITYPHWDTVLHTTTGFISAAFGYAMVDLLNRNKPQHFKLSPVFLALVAFCFSLTVGVLWEFYEFSMDYLFHMDMQKDTVIHAFASVTLDPTNSNIPIYIDNITDVAVNGRSLGLDGYLDVGLYDTMEDLFVNFIGALTFSIIGYFSAKSGKNKIAKQFVPVVLPEETADAAPEETPEATQ